MFVLAVDTCSQAGSVALLNKNSLLAEVNINSQKTHSERLLSAIDFILKSQRLKIEDIHGCALAVGPGYFTGIRIGLSTIKAFAYAGRKPVAPISNLSAMAMKLRHPQSRLLCPILDAKKGEIYSGLFENKFRMVNCIVPEGVYSPDFFFSLLPSNRVIYFIGSGVKVFKEKLLDYFKDRSRFSTRSFFLGYEIGLLGYEVFKNNQGVDFHKLKPFYYRKSQAENCNK